MSTLTSPILLDSTGKDINGTLQGIQDALRAANTLVDDNSVAANRTWSSEKITKALTIEEIGSGATVICKPVAATPVVVEGNVQIGNLILTQTNGTDTIEYQVYIPAAGHFNWASGLLKLEDGNRVYLATQPINALEGTNTFTINSGTITVAYRVVGGAGSSSEAPAWDVIYGGSAIEEV